MRKEKNNFKLCFRSAKGLKLVAPNENLAEVYKTKSKSALNMLNSAKEKQEKDWILDTSYYAKYFIVYSLLMKFGIKSEIHDCTLFLAKSLLVKEGVISEELYAELRKSKDLRVEALYYDKDFGSKEISESAEAAPAFCLKVEQIIEKISPQDIQKIRNSFEALRKDSQLL